jgi:hypothetical protein
VEAAARSQRLAQVLLFPNRGDIATAALDAHGQELPAELEVYAPCRIGEWRLLSGRDDEEEPAKFARDLAGLGLAALD